MTLLSTCFRLSSGRRQAAKNAEHGQPAIDVQERAGSHVSRDHIIPTGDVEEVFGSDSRIRSIDVTEIRKPYCNQVPKRNLGVFCPATYKSHCSKQEEDVAHL